MKKLNRHVQNCVKHAMVCRKISIFKLIIQSNPLRKKASLTIINFFVVLTDKKCEDEYVCKYRPDCNLPQSKKRCPKYCGLCKGKYWEHP